MASVAALRSRNADLPNREKVLVLASIHGKLAMMEIASQTRRLFWPIGARAKKDVLLAGHDNSVASSPLESERQESHMDSRQVKEKLRDEPQRADSVFGPRRVSVERRGAVSVKTKETKRGEKRKILPARRFGSFSPKSIGVPLSNCF